MPETHYDLNSQFDWNPITNFTDAAGTLEAQLMVFDNGSSRLLYNDIYALDPSFHHYESYFDAAGNFDFQYFYYDDATWSFHDVDLNGDYNYHTITNYYSAATITNTTPYLRPVSA